MLKGNALDNGIGLNNNKKPMMKTGKKRFLIATVFILLSALLPAKDSSAAYKCRPDSPYYFSEFNPASWNPDSELNYEEVYKNYDYFEAFFNRSCDEITVKRYVTGQQSSIERYRLNADGSLSKMKP